MSGNGKCPHGSAEHCIGLRQGHHGPGKAALLDEGRIGGMCLSEPRSLIRAHKSRPSVVNRSDVCQMRLRPIEALVDDGVVWRMRGWLTRNFSSLQSRSHRFIGRLSNIVGPQQREIAGTGVAVGARCRGLSSHSHSTSSRGILCVTHSCARPMFGGIASGGKRYRR